MPHLRFANCYWRISADELSLPAICSMAGRVFWSTLVSIILATTYEFLNQCRYGWILITYLFCSVGLFFLSVLCDGTLLAVSLRGTMVETEKRSSIPVYLLIRFILGVLQLICAMFGIITLFYTAVPCSSLYDNSQLSQVFISIVVFSQVADVFALCCCGYLFYGHHVNKAAKPTEESWALSVWESRCRNLTRSIEVCSCGVLGGGNIEGFDEVAKVLTKFFHHDGFLDVVPSDVIAGIILVRVQQRCARRKAFNSFALDDVNGGADPLLALGVEEVQRPDHANIRTESGERPRIGTGRGHIGRMASVDERPRQGVACITDLQVVEDMARCAVFAMAIYTHIMLSVIKPCTGFCSAAGSAACCSGGLTGRGSSSVPCCCCFGGGKRDMLRGTEPVVQGDNSCGMNFAGMSVQLSALRHVEVVYASFADDMSSKAYAVALDHERQLVVVTLRGTLSLEDCITDALCEPVEMVDVGNVWGFDGRGRWAHGGMLKAANHIRGELEQSGLLAKLLGQATAGVDQGPEAETETKPNFASNAQKPAYGHYRLLITGHSLGAGTACILSVLLKNAFPGLRCYSFGTPGCVLDPKSAHDFKQFITSVILSNDLVPRVSFPSICRLRNEVLDAICRAKTSKAHIMQAVFRECDVEDLLHAPGTEPDSELRRSIAHYQGVINERLATMSPSELCLPGRVVRFVKTDNKKFCLMNSPVYSLQEGCAADFSVINVSLTMLSDHFPDRYVAELDKVAARLLQ